MSVDKDVLIAEAADVRQWASGQPDPEMTVSLLTSAAEFDALQAEYDELLAHSEARVFQTFEWQRTWWKHFGEGYPRLQLYFILVRVGSVLIGVAPLFLERVAVLGPLRYMRLAFLGRGPSDYLDIIARRGSEPIVVAEVSRYIADHRSAFDVLLLEDVSDSSPAGLLLYEALCSRGLAGDRFLSDYCPRMQLPASWETTVKSFPPSHRNRLLKGFAKVFENFEARYERVHDPAMVQAAMDDFIRIHQKRWTEVGYRGVFGEERVDRFHRDVAPLLMGKGSLLMAFLRVGGERVVGDYGLLFRGVFSTYLGGATGGPDFLRHSPGLVVLMSIMKECIAEGVGVFDFMRGTERYKYGFGAVNVSNWTAILFSRPGRKGPLLHRAALVREAIVRRADHEWIHLQFHARKNGFPSVEFAKYLLNRIGVLVTDGWQKLRTPEKSIAIAKEQE
jgi:CelD/BcsL family acetyltransferase involved in cellulose biosynthesis